MKITFLGTCSGIEPTPTRRHVSTAVEHAGKLYWFDAGENCSYNACLAGIKIENTAAIFISHCHLDHIGGLPNLLWSLRKLTRISASARRRLRGRRLDICIPNRGVYLGILKMLSETKIGAKPNMFTLNRIACKNGLIRECDGLRLIARSNRHLGCKAALRSFSYRLEQAKRSLVYSGDLLSIDEIDELIRPGCDLLLMETGHHKVEDVCRHLKATGAGVARLIFTHHGRAILRDPDGELKKAQKILGDKVALARDGMVVHLAP